MIEFVDSNSVIPEKQYKHHLEYKGKRLFLQLKIACHNACILKIYVTGSSLNFVCVGIFLSSTVCCRCNETNRNSVKQIKGHIRLKILPWGRMSLAVIQRFRLFLLKTVANKIHKMHCE